MRRRALAVAAGAAALAALFVAARGAPLGVPAADDYLFLHRLRFGPFDPFDAFGAAWYWRPVARQAYFAALGPWLPAVPAAVVAVHAALLLATFLALASLLRRVMPERAALAAAAFPVLVEPARVLLAWPSGAQHLLAMAAVSVALAAAAAGRLVPALAAAAVGLGSLESAALALPLLPLVAPGDARGGRRRWVAAVTALGLAWLAARLAVAGRGVAVPAGTGAIGLPAALEALRLALAAQLGIEDLAAPLAAAALAGYAVALAGAWWTARHAARDPAAPRLAPWALGGALWWAAGTLPLAGILPNWNAWRSCLPGLGLGVACAAWLARGAAWPVALFVAVRLAALLLAAPAPATVSAEVPATASHLSFVRLARLQRTLEATRAALLERPGLPRGTRIRYWDFPRLSEFGFAGSAAVQVWLGDSTARWVPFGGDAGLHDAGSTVIAFNPGSDTLAVWIAPPALRGLALADAAARAGRAAEADTLLARALEAQPATAGRLRAIVLGNRARLRLGLGDVALADSLHRAGAGAVPPAEWLRTEVEIALARRDLARARRAAAAIEALRAGGP